MINQKIIYFLVISHIFPTGCKATPQRFFSKLVNRNQSSNDQLNIDKKYKSTEASHAELKCKNKCITPNELATRFQVRNKTRFIDYGINDTKTFGKNNDDKYNDVEPPASRFSIFNLLSDDDEGEDDVDNEEKLKTELEEEEEEEEDEEGEVDEDEDAENEKDDGDDIFLNFFGSDEDIDLDKPEGTKDEKLLKQYRRHRIRMHNLMFPLLLAYKLKFFTVIPLLLGSLVLLIGSTGIAGFFFALFAAALGIHVKMEHH